MKKILTLLLLVAGTFIWAQAAEDPTAMQYTGRYKFSETSDIQTAEVTYNDKGLHLTTSMGEVTLQHLKGDVFSIVELNGTAEFIRNDEKKVKKVIIKLLALEIEGAKEPTRKSLMFHPLAPQKFLGHYNEG